MIRLRVRATKTKAPAPTPARRPFGLDTPLPVDRRIIERALLRHLAEARPQVMVLALEAPTQSAGATAASMPLAAGVPDLLILAPGARLAFIKIKTQAEKLSRGHHAFADLCRERGIPVLVVRSLPEARAALDRLAL